MAEYLRGELYKATHRKYPYVALGITVILEAVLVLMWAWVNGNGEGMINLSASTGLLMIVELLAMGYYATAITTDIVFSEQYKHNTLKNEVSYGLPRARIYLGKLAAEVLVSLGMCALIFFWYGLLCRFLLPQDGGWTGAMEGVGFALLTALPLWMGCLAFIHMLMFLIRSTTAATLIAVGTVAVAGQTVKLLSLLVSDKFLLLYRVLLTTPLEGISQRLGDWSVVGWAWAVGIGWFLVTTAIGLAVFQKREIS